MELPDASRRVIDHARQRGVDLEVRTFAGGTKTASDAAAAIGCEVAAIVKSLVFVIDGRPVVALVPGDLRLDPAKLARACGGCEVRRASLQEVREASGYAAGGTPPFGHATPLRVFADPGLRRFDRVWAAAGTPTTVFPIDPEVLATVAGATWHEVAG